MIAISRTPLLLLAASIACTPFAAAQPAPAAPAVAPGLGPAATAPLPSRVFAPALAQLRQALAVTKPEKWKAPGPVNQETTANVASIQHDLDGTLPGLLATADSNPESVAEVLPAYRNVEALYDVLLRVTEMSKIVAPDQQSIALQQALRSLDEGRRTLGNQLQTSALNQGHAIVSLESDLRNAQATATKSTAAVPVCPQPAPAAKRKAKPKSTSSATTTPH